MRTNASLILGSICLLLLLVIPTPAQQHADVSGELFKILDTKFGFETKFVKGAPYSAIVETEAVQTLADGNHIRSRTASAVYRDSEGRTRRENQPKMPGFAPEVLISDPTTGTNYWLDTQQRIAFKTPINLLQVELAKKTIPVVTESLGNQMIEGMNCAGIRKTISIAAGAIGNDLPLTTVVEEWYSPELQVLVLTKRSDPRTGETIYRLTKINRSEPDHSLFEIPANFIVKEKSAKRR
jgi:hypothetical protein